MSTTRDPIVDGERVPALGGRPPATGSVVERRWSPVREERHARFPF